jgi:hypothetical protein
MNILVDAFAQIKRFCTKYEHFDVGKENPFFSADMNKLLCILYKIEAPAFAKKMAAFSCYFSPFAGHFCIAYVGSFFHSICQ